ncbi:hypothetical protein ABPG73_008295, partial [Tetrahymena malaccensis]
MQFDNFILVFSIQIYFIFKQFLTSSIESHKDLQIILSNNKVNFNDISSLCSALANCSNLQSLTLNL